MHRQLRRRQARFFRQLPESIGPREGQEAADQGIKHNKNDFSGGIQIAQREVCGVEAEVNAERENQLDEARSRFAEFKNGGPENVSQYQPDEIKVLGNLQNEVKENLAAGLDSGEGLVDDREGKER